MVIYKRLIAPAWVIMATTFVSAALLVGHPGFAEEPKAAENKPEPDAVRVDRYGDPLPRGAIIRLGTVRYRFQSTGLAFLPDGETVVSAKWAGVISFWKARTGKLVRQIDPGKLQISDGFAVSRDGTHLAVGGWLSDATRPGSRNVVRVFDVASGTEVRTFERQPFDFVRALVLTPDGRRLLTLSDRGMLRVEDVMTGAELLQRSFSVGALAFLALSSDGSTLALATGPSTCKIFIWKWETAMEPTELTVPKNRSREIAFSPDGKLLAECSDFIPEVRLWDLKNSCLLHRLEMPEQVRYLYHDVAFSPDGKTIAALGTAGRASEVHLWNPATGKYLKRLGSGSGRLAFSPDGSLLVSGSHVWEFSTGKELAANQQAHRGDVWHVATGDKDLAVTVGADGDNTIRIWDAATGQQRHCLAHNAWFGGIALSPGSTQIVSNGLDDSVCLWDVASGQKVFTLPGHGKSGGGGAVAFAGDGKSFLSWGDDMYLRHWDVRTGKATAEHPIRPTGVRIYGEDEDTYERDMFGSPMKGLFSPDGKQLVLQGSRRIFVFDTATGKELRHFAADGGHPIARAISPDGKILLTSAWGKPIQIRLPNGMVQHTTPMNHPVSLWDLDASKLRKELTLPEQGAGPVAFSADGKLFAAASSGPSSHLRVWDASGREVWSVEGYPGIVRSLAFMLDGKRLVSGMDDSGVLIWDLAKKR